MADGLLSRRELLRRGGGAAHCWRCRRSAAPMPPRSLNQRPRWPRRRRCPTSTAPSACGRSSTRAAPSRSSAARRCCPRCARPWTPPARATSTSTSWPKRSAPGWPTLTQAEWGLVTSGCSAALTHATAACVAGGNPELHVRIPNLQGFREGRSHHPGALAQRLRRRGPRRRRTRPRRSSTLAELEAALRAADGADLRARRPRTPTRARSTSKAIAPIAKAKGVPILVDAAAEILTIPNVHLEHGATLVAYSGGKCLRGPQTARAAARPQGSGQGRLGPQRAAPRPHRGYKVGKEEAIGDADRGRDVGEARPRRPSGSGGPAGSITSRSEVKTVDGVTDRSRAAGRPVEPARRRCACAGIEPGWASSATRRRARCSMASRASRCRRGARRAIAGADRRLDHPLHDGRRATSRSSPTACTPC